MTTTPEAPAQLEALTSFPDRDDPDAARHLASAFGALAHCRAARFNAWTSGEASAPEPWTLLVMSLETVAMVLLMALDSQDRDQAARIARQVIDAWDAEDAIGAMLLGHLAALGIDADEIGRLEDASRALRQAEEAEAAAEVFTVDELTTTMRNRNYSPEHIAQLLRAVRRDREAAGEGK
jgi:hypothetical protein